MTRVVTPNLEDPLHWWNDDGEPEREPIGIQMVEQPDEEDVLNRPPLKYLTPNVKFTAEELAKYASYQELDCFESCLFEGRSEWDEVTAAITM